MRAEVVKTFLKNGNAAAAAEIQSINTVQIKSTLRFYLSNDASFF